MKKKLLMGSFALALAATNAAAQGWVAELDAREVRALRRAADGDLVLVGVGYPEGGILASVRKFTAAGTPVAAFDIGTAGAVDTASRDAVTTPDGHVVICGAAREAGQYQHPWLSAWDLETGAKVWETTTAEPSASFEALAKVPGGYVAAGVSYSANPPAAYAAGFDDVGNILWQRMYNPAVSGRLMDVASTEDGGAVLTAELDFERFVIRIDPAGNPVWSRKIDLVGTSWVSVTLAADGSLFVASTSWTANDPWISRWTLGGDVLWQKEYNSAIGTRVDAIEPAADGGLFVHGHSGAHPTVLRIDADGAEYWHRQFELNDENQYGRVLPTPEGGCYVAWSETDGGDLRSWLARIGAYGDWSDSCDGMISYVWTMPSDATHQVTSESVLTGLVVGDHTIPGIDSSPAAIFASTVCGDVCSNPPRYCTTSPNSAGSGATIGSSGTTSVFANDFVLEASDLPTGQFGIFFYGTQPQALPVGEGVLCVGGSLFRLPVVQSDGAGFSQHALDVNAPPDSAGQITPGATFFFQHWYRDNAGGPAGFNFSNGLAVTFCP